MTRPPFQSAGRLIRYSAPSHTPSRTAGAWPHRPSQRRPPLRRRAARGEMLYRARRAQSSRRHPSHALARVPSCAGSRSSSPSLSSLPEEGRARIALLLDSHHAHNGQPRRGVRGGPARRPAPCRACRRRRLPIDKPRALPAAEVWPCLRRGLSEATTGEAAGHRGRGGERRMGEEDDRGVKKFPPWRSRSVRGSTFYGAARSGFALPWPEPLS